MALEHQLSVTTTRPAAGSERVFLKTIYRQIRFSYQTSIHTLFAKCDG